MNNLSPARLSIWIKGKTIPQGKIFQKDGRWIYLANITSNKRWRNYSGYSIATQILETFSKAHIRPLIIYRITNKNEAWVATPTDFIKKGIPVTFGSHRQQVLPIKRWKAYRERLNEPFKLPDITVNDWAREGWVKKEEQIILGDFSAPRDVLERLSKDFRAKYA